MRAYPFKVQGALRSACLFLAFFSASALAAMAESSVATIAAIPWSDGSAFNILSGAQGQVNREFSFCRLDLFRVGDQSMHFSMNAARVNPGIFNFDMLFLGIPDLAEDELRLDAFSVPVFAEGVSVPLSWGRASLAFVNGFIPVLTDSIQSHALSAVSEPFLGVSGALTAGEWWAAAFWGQGSAGLTIDETKIGKADASIAFAAAGSSHLGLFAGMVRESLDADVKTSLSFITGQYFSADGNVDVKCLGGWGSIGLENQCLRFDLRGAVGVFWFNDTGLATSYREEVNGGITTRRWQPAQSPAGLALLIPSVTYKIKPQIEIQLSRTIPLAWSWGISSSTDGGKATDEAVGAAINITNIAQLSWETILFSGLVFYLKWSYK